MSRRPTSSRLDQASRGIEEAVIQLTDRLGQSGDGADCSAELRLMEALLFAAAEPIDVATLRDRLPKETDVEALLARLQRDYAGRGINLVHVAGRWRFQTAPDLADNLVDVREAPRKLS